MKDETLPIERGFILHIAWVRWWSALAYHALSLAAGMDRIGRPSRVVAPPGSPLDAKARDLGLAAPRWAALASRRPDRFLGGMSALRRGAVKGEIDGVFVYAGPGHAAAAIALTGAPAPLLRVRAVIRRPRNDLPHRWLYARKTDRVLISGSCLEEELRQRLGIGPEKLRLLPAGIDLANADRVDRVEARSALREKLSWPPDAPVVGMLARYSPVKGHRDLIDAARMVVARRGDVRFLVAGQPGQVGRDQVSAWVRDAGLADRFAVLDAVADPYVTAAGFDLAVIASRGSEAVCRSALEYMALGLPIVATKINVIPETVGDASILIPPADPASMATAIGDLLDDPAAARRLADSAASRVRSRFEIGVTARAAAALLDEARKERHETF